MTIQPRLKMNRLRSRMWTECRLPNGRTRRRLRLLTSLDHQPLRKVTKAIAVPIAASPTSTARWISQHQRIQVVADGQRRARSTPWNSGVNQADPLDLVGQLLDREERAGEQEERRDDEPEDDRERVLPLAGRRPGSHRHAEGDAGQDRRRPGEQERRPSGWRRRRPSRPGRCRSRSPAARSASRGGRGRCRARPAACRSWPRTSCST